MVINPVELGEIIMTTLALPHRPIHRAARLLDRLVNRTADFRVRFGGAFDWLRRCHVVYRQRRALLALDAAMLKDIGISRADAIREGKQALLAPLTLSRIPKL